MKRRGRPPKVLTSHEFQRWQNWQERCDQIRESNHKLKLRNQEIFTRREAGEKIIVLAMDYNISIGRVTQIHKKLKSTLNP